MKQRTSKTLACLSAILLTGAAGASAQSTWPSHPIGSPAAGGGPQVPSPLTVAGDATGDTLGILGVQHDIISFEATTIGTNLKIELLFDGPIADNNDPDGLVGFVDLDTDQNSATGIQPSVDIECQAPPSGLGADFWLDMFFNEVIDTETFAITPVAPIYGPSSYTVLIPLSILGNDDGLVNAAAAIGTLDEVTDCAPNNGFITSNIEAPVSAPSMGTWGLIVLATLMTILGAGMIRRRQLA